MDRGSLVASLQNFGQSLARQRMLKESLDDLRKKEAEYERQCKLTERPGTSNPPEESTYDYKRLSAYDEKHKPIQKKPTRIVGWLLCVLCFVLSFVILAPAIYALIMLVLFTLAGYSISETIDAIKSSINEPTSGTFLVGGAAVIGAIIGAWYATAFMAGIIGDLMSESYDERYKKLISFIRIDGAFFFGSSACVLNQIEKTNGFLPSENIDIIKLEAEHSSDDESPK